MRRRARLWLAAIFVACGPIRGSADDFDAWILSRGQIQTIGHPPTSVLPVGSLQKPFLVRAWALSHPQRDTPKFTCTSTSGCWRPSGHGTLDLRGAIRESCNTFFKLLAHETPQESIRASFRDAGFEWKGDVTDAEAIGLPGPANVRIKPERLIAAYSEMVRTPWPVRDDVRGEVLAGLRDAANDGTASGVRLRGFLAKTGTVPALDGAALKTSGFAMVLDDAGFAFLGSLRRGTGREAAIRAGVEIARLRPGSLARLGAGAPNSARSLAPVASRQRNPDDPVRVEMLSELRLKGVRLKNVGQSPVDSSHGFMGAGATVDVASGDRFSNGDWQIQSSKPVFERRVRAAIEVTEVQEALRLIATMTARDYSNGVVKAEMSSATPALRAPLAAAVLRFLSRGPRHQQNDVCDSTHCAWFVGEGPVPRWLRPDAATNESTIAPDLSDAEWNDALAAARAEPHGPDQWTAYCGGDPVSAHFVWGNGDRHVNACPRHPRGSGKTWRRDWPAADLAAIFGMTPDAISVVVVDGQWMLKAGFAAHGAAAAKSIGLTYDEAHRRLAARLGWDAMPSLASRVSRTASGFVAEGVGFGHRVGLCLAP